MSSSNTCRFLVEAPAGGEPPAGLEERPAQQPDRPLGGERAVVVAHAVGPTGVGEQLVERPRSSAGTCSRSFVGSGSTTAAPSAAQARIKAHVALGSSPTVSPSRSYDVTSRQPYSSR